MTYKDIRENCGKAQKKVNILATGWKLYCSAFWYLDREGAFNWLNGHRDLEHFTELCVAIFLLLMLYLTFPIYLASRVATVLFPYFVMAYLSYFALWHKMALFELTMLGCYVLLQLLIVVLGMFVCRTHLWLWHVLPGEKEWNMSWPEDLNPFLKRTYAFYDSVQWLPVTREIVLKHFGTDIGQIVMIYVAAMNELDEA